MQGWKSLVDHIDDHSLTPVWIIIMFHHQEISYIYIGWKSIRSIGLWDQQNKWRRHFPNRLHWLELCRKQSKKENVVKGKDKLPQLIKAALKTERRDMLECTAVFKLHKERTNTHYDKKPAFFGREKRTIVLGYPHEATNYAQGIYLWCQTNNAIILIFTFPSATGRPIHEIYWTCCLETWIKVL